MKIINIILCTILLLSFSSESFGESKVKEKIKSEPLKKVRVVSKKKAKISLKGKKFNKKNKANQNSKLNKKKNEKNKNQNDAQSSEKQEIRDQNIFVPTTNGVQRATFEEAVKVNEFEQMPLTKLTKSYLLGDFKSGKILESFNIDEIRAMASMSKLVGIFVVYDNINSGKIKKNDVVNIDHESTAVIGSKADLKEGEKKTVEELLNDALIISANDAMTALGKYIAGSNDAFVAMLNKKCKELGFKNAKIINATGLTNYEINEYNEMTTRDMFKLTVELLKKYPEILEITKKNSLKNEKDNVIKFNTNPILDIVKEVDGLKTGYTNAAGRCVISTGIREKEKNYNEDIRLIGITTGSNNDWERFVAIKRIMENGFNNYSYKIIDTPENKVTSIKIDDANRESIPIFTKNVESVLKSKKDIVKNKIELKNDLKAPLNSGDIVGSITYYVNDKEVLKDDLIVKNSVYRKGLIFKIQKICEDIFFNLEKANS